MSFYRRMLYCTISVVALLTICWFSSSYAEENLLRNPGFEKLDNEGMPSDWLKEAWITTEGYTSYSVSDNGVEGGNCASIVNFAMNDARLVQTVKVEPNTVYCLSGWIRAEDIADAGWGANLSVNGIFSSTEGIFDTEGEWIYTELYGETGEDQTELTVCIRVGGYSGESMGSASFDDLSLVKVDSVPEDVFPDLWYVTQSVAYENGEDAGDPIFSDNRDSKTHLPLFLLICFCYFVAAYAGSRITNKQRIQSGNKKTAWILLSGMLLSFVARVVIAWYVEGYSVDINCFSAWGARMAAQGPVGFYSSDYFCDYPPAYMYLLGINRIFVNWFCQAASVENINHVVVFANKLIPMLSDIGIACLICHICKKRNRGEVFSVFAALLTAWNPVLIVNSAAWGQIDSVLALLLVLVVWTAIQGKWQAVMPLYVLAVLVKPQALMLGPVGLLAIILSWIQKPEVRRSMLIGVAWALLTALVILLPCSIGQSPTWIIDKYGETLSSYSYATVNTANLHFLSNANWQDLYQPAAPLSCIALSLYCLGWAAWLIIQKNGEETLKNTVRVFLPEIIAMILFALAFQVMLLGHATWAVVGYTSMGMAFSIVILLYLRCPKPTNLPLLGSLLFIMLYTLSIKMHERYLFPAIALLFVAYAIRLDERILKLLVFQSAVLFINIAIPLDNNLVLGSDAGHLNYNTVSYILAGMNVFLAVYALVVTGCTLLREGANDVRGPIMDHLWTNHHVSNALRGNKAKLENFTPDVKLHWKKADTLLMLGITLIYSVVAFVHLGSTRAPQSEWTSSSANEEIVLDLGEHHDAFSMLYYCGVSYHDFSVAVSDDAEKWSEEYWAHMDQGECFRWSYLMPCYLDASGSRTYGGGNTYDDVKKLSGRYVRITAQQIHLSLYEVIFRTLNPTGNGYTQIPVKLVSRNNGEEKSSLYSPAESVIDEQDSLEGDPTWYTGTYFDEIYHARTAFEHLHGLEPYETTHPPLGKLLMAAAIAIFGMTPFGWRFAGAFAGVLMLPVMYLLAKQMTKKTWCAATAASVFALDCMHFTQTRIATIDSFPVLFILCSYFFMLRFMQRDLSAPGKISTLLPDLAFSGFFMGCSIASKWIGIYAGIGLALLYFWTCARHINLSRESLTLLVKQEETIPRNILKFRSEQTFKRILILCAWCLVFFVAIPLMIYLLCYIPYFAARKVGSIGEFLQLVLNAQNGMLGYHSQPGLGMDHPFYSPWYEWPFLVRPMYYAMAYYQPKGYSMSIFCFGNPVVCYVGLLGVAVTVFVWAKRHLYLTADEGRIIQVRGKEWSVIPAFILIGLMAQFLPWVLVPRGTYMYHYFASIPFLVLGTTMTLYWIQKQAPKVGIVIAVCYIFLCLIAFIAFYPYASGATTPVGWLDFMSQFLHLYHS